MISERMSESGDEWGFEVKRGHLSRNQLFFFFCTIRRMGERKESYRKGTKRKTKVTGEHVGR